MKNIKHYLLGIFLFFSASSYAEVAEVYQWKAFPGKSQDMLVNMSKAAEIHRAEGAQVSINAHNIGSTQLVDYVVRWDKSKADLHAEHESFVTNMKWTMNSDDSVTFENIVILDGESTKNVAQINRVY